MLVPRRKGLTFLAGYSNGVPLQSYNMRSGRRKQAPPPLCPDILPTWHRHSYPTSARGRSDGRLVTSVLGGFGSQGEPMLRKKILVHFLFFVSPMKNKIF